MVSMKTDERVFPYIGNNLAIDFLNTEIADRGGIIELLASPKDMYVWCQAAGLAVDKTVRNAELSQVLEFRNALKSIFVAVLDKQPIPQKSLSMVNQHLLNDSREQQLKCNDGKIELQPAQKKLSIESVLGRIASEAASLLCSQQLDKLKKCANPKCVLMFLDTSKSGRRRWCSMDVCGNRAKAASHYINSRQE